MVGSDGMHNLIFQRAFNTGQSFPTTVQRMVSSKELSRSSAQSVNFTDAGVRGVELRRGFVDMGDYARNEWAYREKLKTRMGLKSVGKINKEIEKLEMLTQERLTIGVMGLLDRLTKRRQLEKINSVEFIGHQHDRDELLRVIKVDIEDVGFKMDIKNIINSIAPRMVDPQLDLTTCKLENATIVAKMKNLEERKDIEKIVNNEIGDKLPGALPDSPIFCIKGKLIYEFNDSFKIELVLETPLTNLYRNERYLLNNIGNKNYIMDIFRAGGTPHVSEDGRYCMKFNYPHASFGGTCSHPNCIGKKLCMQCDATHNQRGCPLHCSSYAAVGFNPRWEDTPVPHTLAHIHESGRGRRGHGQGRGCHHTHNYGGGSRVPPTHNYKLNWDGEPYYFGVYDNTSTGRPYGGNNRSRNEFDRSGNGNFDIDRNDNKRRRMNGRGRGRHSNNR